MQNRVPNVTAEPWPACVSDAGPGESRMLYQCRGATPLRSPTGPFRSSPVPNLKLELALSRDYLFFPHRTDVSNNITFDTNLLDRRQPSLRICPRILNFKSSHHSLAKKTNPRYRAVPITVCRTYHPYVQGVVLGHRRLEFVQATTSTYVSTYYLGSHLGQKELF
ncbi:hypothetical protein FHL15_006657 [Xylaria flabelliformis]|uniref:Uncharacterized protein n=1 Tax=Xylaria flabelliformis TaxID=2512241 RepID=A0A553HX06_9PEZI|nr:hypothetical protein FHL15_006657 [Xylaria flabelliformis]